MGENVSCLPRKIGKYSNMKWVILIMAIVLNGFANIFIKAGIAGVGGKQESLILFLKFKHLSLPIISGIACFVLALAAYSYVLSKFNLSIAYPIMTSLSFVIVILASRLVFKESITPVQVAGFILILSGVWLVAR
jgi:multidrug transporter EmrE-like cation transporter